MILDVLLIENMRHPASADAWRRAFRRIAHLATDREDALRR
jgi:hemoglobin-like flavoprotein